MSTRQSASISIPNNVVGQLPSDINQKAGNENTMKPTDPAISMVFRPKRSEREPTRQITAIMKTMAMKVTNRAVVDPTSRLFCR